MKKIKTSLIAFFGILAFVGLVTFLIPSPTQGQASRPSPLPPPLNVKVVNTESEPVPVTGTVNVGSVVQTQSAIPPGAFSAVITNSGPISGPDAAGTSYAITSMTVSNQSGAFALVNLNGRWGQTNDCTSFSGSLSDQPGPDISVPAFDTVHLSFPQPFILSAQEGAAGCLSATSGGGVPVRITVVGYRF